VVDIYNSVDRLLNRSVVDRLINGFLFKFPSLLCGLPLRLAREVVSIYMIVVDVLNSLILNVDYRLRAAAADTNVASSLISRHSCLKS
jgi:hypothetical protein